MSREIQFGHGDDPRNLTSEEMLYLVQRPWRLDPDQLRYVTERLGSSAAAPTPVALEDMGNTGTVATIPKEDYDRFLKWQAEQQNRTPEGEVLDQSAEDKVGFVTREEAAEMTEESRDYKDMTNDELDVILLERDLPLSGKKSEKIARLEADDAEKAGSEDEEE